MMKVIEGINELTPPAGLGGGARGHDDYDRQDADWLRDQLRQRDRDIAELRAEAEKDEQADVIHRFDEHAPDYSGRDLATNVANGTIELWQETFGMQLDDNGKWTWGPFWEYVCWWL